MLTFGEMVNGLKFATVGLAGWVIASLALDSTLKVDVVTLLVVVFFFFMGARIARKDNA